MIEARMLAGDRSAPDLWKRYDWEFHHALISACGSRAHLDAHNAAYDKYLRYQMIAVVFRGEIAAREHRQLLECALKRDTKSAQGVLVKHIQDCVSYTLANWPSELRAHGRAPAPRQTRTSRLASA
jgi:DNA-binding GntR family transcriptional regulator